MTRPNRLTAMLRNAVFRIAKGVPPGAVSPVVRNDRFQVEASLYRFLGAFAATRRTLYVGDQPYGAFAMARDAEAQVTAVVSSAAARWFGRSHFGDGGIRFVRAVDEKKYEVVIDATLLRGGMVPLISAMEANGKLLVTVPAGRDESRVRSDLAGRFAHVRRFVQTTRVEVDFSSPFYSTLALEALSFSETSLSESTPADALAVAFLATDAPEWGDLQLHIGCGPVTLPGWVNNDVKPYPGVDFCADVLTGISFRDVRHIYAEHFIEHLSYPDAVKFVTACRAALRDDGVLRLSTPNLDWVVPTAYTATQAESEDDRLRDCLELNRAFRAWGHQFLYNLAGLKALLQNAGFATIRTYSYGESDTPELAGLEHHEKYNDYFDESHIIIVEASGRADPASIRGEAHIRDYVRDLPRAEALLPRGLLDALRAGRQVTIASEASRRAQDNARKRSYLRVAGARRDSAADDPDRRKQLGEEHFSGDRRVHL